MKKHVEPLASTLDRVIQLRPVSYRYGHQSNTAKRTIGFLALQVESLFPEAVTTQPGGDMKGVSYSDFGVVAIKAIQEQQKKIDEQQSAIDLLLQRVQQLERRN